MLKKYGLWRVAGLNGPAAAVSKPEEFDCLGDARGLAEAAGDGVYEVWPRHFREVEPKMTIEVRGGRVLQVDPGAGYDRLVAEQAYEEAQA